MFTVTSATHKTEKDLANTNLSDLLFLRIVNGTMVVVGCIEGDSSPSCTCRARDSKFVLSNGLSVVSFSLELFLTHREPSRSVSLSLWQIGMKVVLFIPKFFIQNHFHPKTTFIRKPLSSKSINQFQKSCTSNPEPLNP